MRKVSTQEVTEKLVCLGRSKKEKIVVVKGQKSMPPADISDFLR